MAEITICEGASKANTMPAAHHPRTLVLPPMILGGSGFSYQVHPDPKSVPVSSIIRRAFDAGMTAIDTSPYYEPSEQLLGEALASDEIRSKYSRADYLLMTKVGRLSEAVFDYSPAWIKASVQRSLHRLGTTYLDVVFCHDVEFVSPQEAIEGVGVLFELCDQGVVRFVGISGYSIDRLIHVAQEVRKRYQRPLHIVQNWARLNLLNSSLERYGIPALRKAGISVICNASPLASGLLRSGRVPCGRLGDWHPAPAGLRNAVQKASEWVEKQQSSLAVLALRFALARASQASQDGVIVRTIVGICSISDLKNNLQTIETILYSDPNASPEQATDPLDISRLDRVQVGLEPNDHRLYRGVRAILQEWKEYDFEKGKRRFLSPSRKWLFGGSLVLVSVVLMSLIQHRLPLPAAWQIRDA